MSSYHLDDEVFGDGSFSVCYGKGFGGNGKRMHHFVLDVEDKLENWVVVAMTPEDAVKLSIWLVDKAKQIKDMEDNDTEHERAGCDEDDRVVSETIREMDNRIPSARECENKFQDINKTRVEMSLRDGFNIPLPPSRLDLINYYAIMRRMGYTPEQLAKGMYSTAHGPETQNEEMHHRHKLTCARCGVCFDLDDEVDGGRLFLREGDRRIPVCGDCIADLVMQWDGQNEDE